MKHQQPARDTALYRIGRIRNGAGHLHHEMMNEPQQRCIEAGTDVARFSNKVRAD
jgi:hypothetical protein